MDDEKWAARRRAILEVLFSALAVLATIVAIAIFWSPGSSGKPSVPLVIILGLWLVGPPIWFVWEWWIRQPLDDDAFARFKHSQELTRNLWLAVAAFLALLFGVKP